MECPLSLISVLPSPLHNAALVGTHLFLTSSYSSYTHGHGITFFFCDIAVSSALNKFVQLDASFAIFFFYFHDLFHLQLQLYWRRSISTSPLHRPCAESWPVHRRCLFLVLCLQIPLLNIIPWGFLVFFSWLRSI